MITSSRATWVLALASLCVTACSLVVDFDRAKLRGDAGVDGGPLDGGQDDAGGLVPDTGSPPDGSGRCSEDSQCGPNDLCCDGLCTPARVAAGCATCDGTACGGGADGCNARACACGLAPACSGASPYCDQKIDGAPGEMICAGCRGDTDCGSDQVCVRQQCKACDHTKGNTGCKNPTPVCADDDTCVACGPNAACPAPLSCKDAGCFGCDDTTNAGCDATSTTPVCDLGPGGLQCEACASDVECAGNPGGGQCLANGACRACDPAESDAQGKNAACTDPSRSFCSQDGTCRGCTATSCDTPNAPVCGASGQCVECANSAQCSASLPVCGANGRCRTCNVDNDCAGSRFGDHCSAGQCVPCTADGQCGSGHCNLARNVCVECNRDLHCVVGARPICGAGGVCVPCTGAGGGDAACAGKNAALPVCTANGCVQCTASSLALCNDNNLCTTNTCSANTCQSTPVSVDDSNPCTEDTCVPATGVSNTLCPQAAFPFCVAGVGCRECRTNTDCGAATPVCSASYTCVAAPGP